MIKVLKYTFVDLIRGRWTFAYFAFFLTAAFSLLYFSPELSRAVVSLMNIVLILCPLIGTLFGIMYAYQSREFVELLLAQPIKRRDVFLGQFLGVAFSLSLSIVLGLGIPFVIYGLFVSGQIWNFAILLLAGTLLTASFSGIAMWIALAFEDRLKGFGLAIVVWLFLAVIYDGLLLMALTIFDDYPLEKFALVASIFNPIDLSRILVMLKLDISALLGYTGAVFNKFLGTGLGMSLAAGTLMLWAIIPVFGFLRTARRKDF